MSSLRLLSMIIFLTLAGFLFGQADYNTAKPWTYWWWMGSAVDRENISRELTAFAEAGFGGVHIIPIYGAKGFEDRFLHFLSDEWLEMIDFTIHEAGRLGLGVDLTLGTGWPFGGPWINPRQAAKKLAIDTLDLGTTNRIALSLSDLRSEHGWLTIDAAVATSEKGQLNLTSLLHDDQLEVSVAPADWSVILLGSTSTGQQVKRAAPGGEGPVIDYFDRTAVDHYLHRFDSVFSSTPRAVYHDSYEVYGANWTPAFLEAFKKQQGYDLTAYLPVLQDTAATNYPFLLHDIRATLAELLFTEFAANWTRWAAGQDLLSRYQAHGSPANILDLYAQASIPETESFGCSAFAIPGLECDPDYEEWRFGRPSPLMMKFASSPAHLLDKPLVSSETGTWLANHFKVSLKQVKPQVDELFVSGINHIFYHGITYSPLEEGFPGWLFYASTNFGPTSHFWEELPLLNRYIENCQRQLQESQPDNDILLYFPIDDLWTNAGGDISLLLDVHHYDRWFSATAVGQAAEWLWEEGYSFDYLSDRQLLQLQVDPEKKVFLSENVKYQVLLLPAIDYIPESAFAALEKLAEMGTKIVVAEHLPGAFAGLTAKKNGSAGLKERERRLLLHPNVIVTEDLPSALTEVEVSREVLKQQGLDFIRKRNDTGEIYFVTNLGDQFYRDTIRLSVDYRYLTIIDPSSGKQGYLEKADGVVLQIPPGQSYFLQTSKVKPDEDRWSSYQPYDTISLNAEWKVRFDSRYGEEPLPERKVDSLRSWTDWGDEALQSFSGKAIYTATFRLDNSDLSARSYRLHLEEVLETAAVRINGNYCGTIWAYPLELNIPVEILEEENRIEIIVQNLSANYIKLYDEKHPEWKKFYDINFVDITYTPFKPSVWEDEPSGLIGNIYLLKEK